MMRLATISPCYNEEDVLEDSVTRLTTLFNDLIQQGHISADSIMVFVNDGSKDRTWELICKLQQTNKFVRGINLASNVGHQNAMMAGMMTARTWADAVVTIDADLQDDLNAIPLMIHEYTHNNCEVVYGVKTSRQADPLLKRLSATAFYRLQNKLGVKSVFNHADFRLMSKRVLMQMENYKEVNLFLRGIVPLIGYPADNVYYERQERFAGESKYPLKKMLSFAFDGITSFSVKPIRFILSLGLVIFLASLGILIYSIVRHAMGATVLGWSSLMVSIWALGGLQLLAIGIVGEYIGKMYLETKGRPRFAIQDILNDVDRAE